MKPLDGYVTKKYSVYFLQEVHSTEQTSKLWANEWCYNAIFSHCTSSKAGVCIPFNNNFSFQILKQRSDPDGRFAIVDIKTNEKISTLINIYAPNKDDPDFIQKVIGLLLAELQRAKRASGAPWVRNFGKPSSQENLVIT